MFDFFKGCIRVTKGNVSFYRVAEQKGFLHCNTDIFAQVFRNVIAHILTVYKYCTVCNIVVTAHKICNCRFSASCRTKNTNRHSRLNHKTHIFNYRHFVIGKAYVTEFYAAFYRSVFFFYIIAFSAANRMCFINCFIAFFYARLGLPKLIKSVARSTKVLDIIYEHAEHLDWLSKGPHQTVKGYQLSDCHFAFDYKITAEQNEDNRKQTTKSINPRGIFYAYIGIVYGSLTVIVVVAVKLTYFITFADKSLYNAVSFNIFANSCVQNSKLIAYLHMSRTDMYLKFLNKEKNKRSNCKERQHELPVYHSKCNNRKNVYERIFKTLI